MPPRQSKAIVPFALAVSDAAVANTQSSQMSDAAVPCVLAESDTTGPCAFAVSDAAGPNEQSSQMSDAAVPCALAERVMQPCRALSQRTLRSAE
tara:strand:- start:236 stop:517 length:282 start_codon:yes stop_codon:yes gene_type:complete